MTKLLGRFHKLMFGKYILTTNIVSSGILMAAGDVIQQHVEYRNKLRSTPIDYSRLGRMFAIGLIEGPIHHVYYMTFLERILPKSDLSSVGKKIILDQFVASPLFIFTFFYGLGMLERKSLNECNTEIMTNAWEVYVTDWCVWPPVQFINFYYLPQHYRVTFINLVTTLYNCFLSYVKHRDLTDVCVLKDLDSNKIKLLPADDSDKK